MGGVLRHNLGNLPPSAPGFSNSVAIVPSRPDCLSYTMGVYLRQKVRIMIARRLPRPLCCALQSFQLQPHLRRPLSVKAGHQPTTKVSPVSLSPRWLSDVKQRLGKCMMFGMRRDQVDEAGQILQELARDWRTLFAGSEGFLTGKGRVGLHSQAVVWGEQDTMVG